MADLGTALVTALTTTATAILSNIGTILPVVLPITGGIILLTVGLKVFKRFAK